MSCPDEDVLAAFTDGVLVGSEASTVREHVETCEMCRAVLQLLGAAPGDAGPPAAPEGDAPREGHEPTLGTRVGRFLILHPVGAGGMGVVYAAYDPELDRKVALKLVRAGPGQRKEGQRLLREAQAIARLNHPHVVSLFDVGTWGDEVFLAMEFVEGSTLTQWLKTGPGRRAVLEAFVSAGEGLAAAHRAGLVHRDFKPDNVLVGQEGRVRVTDFGLARHVDAVSGSEAPPDPEQAPTGLLTYSLTGTDALVGTPAYMAPEQHARKSVDARSDQFSFCVTLWEALYGERPFAGQSAAEVGQAVQEGRVSPARREARVPERLRQMLLRGLAVRPEERFPSMDALLEVLRRETGTPRLRRWALAGAVLMGALLTAAGLMSVGAQSRLMCRRMAQDVSAVWNEGRREQIRRAFDAAPLPYAHTAFENSVRLLDTYARGWSQARVEACEATHVRGEQSGRLLDARMQCLNERLFALRSFTELLASADKELVGRAVQASQALPRLEDCAEKQALSAMLPPPREPEARQRFDAAQAEVAQSLVLANAGRYDEALKVATSAVTTAKALGHAALQADALFQLSVAQQALQLDMEAENTLYQAFEQAQRGRNDQAAARAATSLTLLLGTHLRQHAQAYRWGSLSKALIERAGESPQAEGVLLSFLGAVLFDEDRLEESIALYQQAFAVRKKYDSATDTLGDAQLRNNLGTSLVKLGRYDEALEQLRPALAIREKELGPDHPEVAATLSNIALTLMLQGHAAEGVPLSERALAMMERSLGPDHSFTANMLETLALMYSNSGRLDEAVKRLAQAQAVYEKLLGPEAPVLARVHSNMGGFFLSQKDYPRAVDSLRRALAINEKVLGTHHPSLAEELSLLGRAYLGLGQAQEAQALLEQALSIVGKGEGQGHIGLTRAQTELWLGQALWQLGRERERARTLVQAALTHSRTKAHNAVAHGMAAAAEKWLAAHPAR